jgi:hypothetical protein
MDTGRCIDTGKVTEMREKDRETRDYEHMR